jgi:magnesium transporter
MITDCAVYTAGCRGSARLELSEAFQASQEPDSFVWLGLHEPTPDEFKAIQVEFSLHELAVEDALKPHQRPKLEVYDDTLFVVLRTARYVDPEEVVEIGQIMLFVGDGFVVSVRYGEGMRLAGIRKELEGRPEFLKQGPGAVLHAIMDRVVDAYIPVLEGLDHDIGEIEHDVFSPNGSSSSERIYKLKREVLEFSRATTPLVEPLHRLVRGHLPHISGDTREYFRDVEDHLLRVVSQVRDSNDLLTSMLDANLAQVTLRQNSDMRKISAWVAIAAVPTMVAGIYGMNFDHMPELRWTYGYPLVASIVATVCVLLYRGFKRAGWL